MNLAKLLNINIVGADIILVGTPEITNFTDSDDKPYFLAKLLNPVTVRCSVDPLIEPFETDEVYVRQSDISAEGWELVDEKDPSKGFFRKGWVVDFSKGQKFAVYQSETIKKWARGNRGLRRDEERSALNETIRKMIKDKVKSGSDQDGK